MFTNPCKICSKSDKEKGIKQGYCIHNAKDGQVARCAPYWTGRKHKYVEDYCNIVSIGMKNRFKEINYIDLFAGPGRYFERNTGKEFFMRQD
jgi:hypothetical protein